MTTPEYVAAKMAVWVVAADKGLRRLGEIDGKSSYCPRCGQRPDHDIRHDAAFELAYGNLHPELRKCDLHFAIELARWLS